jgi:hypothetical protein
VVRHLTGQLFPQGHRQSSVLHDNQKISLVTMGFFFWGCLKDIIYREKGAKYERIA